MEQENKKSHYHIWDSEQDLMANVNTEVVLPDGARFTANIGKVAIKKGDALYFDYGRSMGVSTRSGQGYESEFKHGKVVMHCGSASLILEQEHTQFVQPVTTSKEEFDEKVKTQKARIAPEIENLKDIFIFEETQRRTEARRVKAENEQNNKDKIKNAVNQMSEAFSQKPKP
jgi:hypothetical protein